MTHNENENNNNNDLNEGRKKLPLLLNICFLLMKSGNNLLYLSALTIFLKQIGSANLPWVYLIVNAFFIAIQFGLISRIPGREGSWLLSKLSLVSLSLSLFGGFFLSGFTGLAPMIILVLAMLTDLNSTQAFGNMVNSVLTIQEAKKCLPMIYAAGSVGYIISGITMKFVLDIVGIGGLLIGNAFFLLIFASLATYLQKYEKLRDINNRIELQVKAKKPMIDKETLMHPLAKALMMSSFLIIFNKFLIDFLFVTAINKFFTESKSLASFMGVFSSTVDFIVIGLQTFVMHRIFSKYQLGRILAIMPAILSALCVFSFLNSSFIIIAVIQFCVLLNSKNFTVPATTMLMGAVPEDKRSAVRRNVSVSCSIASTLVGVFLLMMQTIFTAQQLFLFAAAVYAFMSAVHYSFDRAYSISLRQTLSSDNKLPPEEQLKALRLLNFEEKVCELKACLQQDDSSIRLNAIKEIALLPNKNIFELLMPRMTEEMDTTCLTLIAKTLFAASPQKAMAQIELLLSQTDDTRLKADLIEMLGNTQTSESVENMIKIFLDDEHHRVRGSAILSMIRLTSSNARLETALKGLAKMVRSKAALFRATSAAIIGELGFPLFIPALRSLAFDNEFIVAQNAVGAIAKIGTTEAISILEKITKSTDAELSALAKNKLKNASKRSIKQIARLMGTITSEERMKLAKRLKSFHEDGYHEILSRILTIENVSQRKYLLDTLERADEETMKLIDACVVWEENNKARFQLDASLWEKVNSECFVEQPLWFELIRVFSYENSDTVNIDKCLSELAKIFRNTCLAGVAIESIILKNPKRYEKLWTNWKSNSLVLAKVIAYLTHSPVPFIKAIDEYINGNNFSVAIAQEYLETQLGSRLKNSVLPLLKPEHFMKLENVTSFKDMLIKTGMATEELFKDYNLDKYLQKFEINEDSE